MGWLQRWRERRAKRAIRKLPKIERGAVRFAQAYPDYSFGRGSYGLPIVHDWKEGSTLKIGAYCSIAEGVQIFLGGHHRADWVTTFPFPAMLPQAAHIRDYSGTHGDVTIGNDVWLCSDCTILSGVTIGSGAIIAAGTLVTRDVEPYAVMGGNPAKFLRWRFPEEQRQQLLQSAWWDWPEAELHGLAQKLCSDDIEGFLDYARQRQPS
ncbi:MULTISPECIES: CatB-related O-acetyltransferase [unclassified Pseudomonas]|uniref:CatB-related O-acetyltransferase n=1 Tax=unclassified Pseudomonas TaxID=196821 RepID=UPI00200FE505|nr:MULTISPECIES: CatB-related O-acetyltransferase [unclassified Pseudomonas]